MTIHPVVAQSQTIQDRPISSEKPSRADRSDSRTERPVKPAGGDSPRGVVRLLEEGHFKGVADVRLRINFHEELSARQTQRSSEAVFEVLDQFGQEVESILAGHPELAVDFRSWLDQLPTDYSNDGRLLLTELDNLEADLLERIELDAEGDPSLLVEELKALFAEVQGSVEEALSGSLLPPISPPTGNGRAYAKFLAIYEQLHSEGPSPESFNTTA